MTPEQIAKIDAQLKAGVGKEEPPAKSTSGGGSKQSSALEKFLDFIMDRGETFAQRGMAQAAGAAEGLTLGNAGPMMRGAFNNGGLPPWLGAGVNAASNIISGGKEQTWDSSGATSMLDEAQAKQPIDAAIGNVAGAIAPAIVAPEVGLPNAAARVAANIGVGAGEGGVYSRSKGGSALEGAELGALGGATGSLLSEAALPTVRWLKNTDPGKRAVDALSTAAKALRGDKEFPTDRLSQQLAALGPNATIADLPEMQGLAKSVLYDPRLVDQTADLSAKLNARIDDVVNPGKTIKAQFKDDFQSLIPDIVDRSGNAVNGPRSEAAIRADIKAQEKEIVPKFDEALDAVSTAQVKRRYLTDMADGIFKSVDANGVAVSPTKGGQKALNFIYKRLDDLALGKTNSVEQKNWRRGVAEARSKGVEAPPPPGFINPRDVQTLRLDLDPLIRTAQKKDPHTAQQLIAFKNSLTDNILNEVPGYKGLNDAWRSEEGYLKASQLGSSVFSMPQKDLMTVPDKLMELEKKGDRAGFAEGFFNELNNRLASDIMTGKAIDKITDNEGFRQAIRLIVPDKADEFIKQLGIGLKLANSSAELTRGTGRTGAVAAGSLDHARAKFNAARLVGWALNIVKPGTGISSASAMGAIEQSIPSGLSPKTAVPLTQMLSAQGPQAQSMLQQIGAGQTPQLTGQSLIDSMLENRLLQNPILAAVPGNLAVGQRERAN